MKTLDLLTAALDRWLARHQERRQADREAEGGGA